MEQATLTDESKPARWRLYKVATVALLLVLGIGVAAVWKLLLPEAPAAAPGQLTDRDKREIARLCRGFTIHLATDKLRKGEFGWFGQSVNVLFRQRISRFIADRDGTYRVYVVVYDQNSPDGFYAWSRHQMVKTNGHWKVIRSY